MYPGSGEKAQTLRALSNLPADPGSIPGTHNMDHHLLLHQAKDPPPSSGLQGHCMYMVQKYMHVKHPYISIKIVLKIKKYGCTSFIYAYI